LFIKSLNDDYGEFRADFDANDFNLKRWTPGVVTPAEAEPAAAESAGDWI
jgi:hypothetical protein